MAGGSIPGWNIVFLVGNVLTAVLLVLVLGNMLNSGSTFGAITYSDGNPVWNTTRFGLWWWGQFAQIVTLIALALFGWLRMARVRNRFLGAAHLLTSIVTLLVSILVIVLLAMEISICNNTALSPCTDARYCCLNTALTPLTPSSIFLEGCPIQRSACDLSALFGTTDMATIVLRWNPVFLWTFVLTLVLVLVSLVHLVCGIRVRASGEESEVVARTDALAKQGDAQRARTVMMPISPTIPSVPFMGGKRF